MKSLEFKIGNEKEVVRQLFNLYGSSPVTALKEYISNALDAADAGRGTHVNIIVNKADGSVMVQDNGLGMSYEKLQSLPQSIGDSESKGCPSKRGEKAFGLLAFGGFADRASLVTRSQQLNGHYGILFMDKKNLEAGVDKVEQGSLNKVIYGPEFPQGTRVIIGGVSKNTIEHYFQPEKLRQALQEYYDPLLRNGKLALTVGYLGRQEKICDILSAERHGVRAVDGEYTTALQLIKHPDGIVRPGTLEAYLHVNADSTQEKIGLYNKGVLVVRSLTQLREFNRFPWNTGHIDGSLNEDFCELIPSREGHVRDEKFEQLCDVILKLEPQITERVKGAQRASRMMRDASLVRTLENALRETYNDLPPPWNRTRGPAPPGTGGGGGAGGTGGSGPGTPRLPRAYPIRCEEFPLATSASRSRFDGEQGIFINRGHGDYEAHVELGNEDQRWLYLSNLISKEAAFGDFALSRPVPDAPLFLQEVPEIGERQSALFSGLVKKLGLFSKKS